MTKDDANRHNDFPAEFRPEARFNRNALSPQLAGCRRTNTRCSTCRPTRRCSTRRPWGAGCRRRPSGGAALEAGGKPVNAGEWNLRDRETWDAFAKHAAGGRRPGDAIPPEHWPDRGAFPGDPPPGTPATPAAARPGRDGAFLFRPVPSNDGAFADLVGNVAEYVCEVPDAFARWNAKRTAEGVKGFLANTASGDDAVAVVAVIGGSALSPADVPPDKPLPVTRTDRGFSDVGIRLAFTAPARDLAERLRYTLAGDEYVWPRPTASADTRTR
jgi:hypothetical protein